MKNTEETKRKLSEMRKGEKNQRLDNHPKIVYNWGGKENKIGVPDLGSAGND